MHYGAILAKGEVGYTDLDKVLAALGNIQENYNWLLTDCECNVDIPELEDEFCWMSGSELTALQRKYHNPQWIWGWCCPPLKSPSQRSRCWNIRFRLPVITASSTRWRTFECPLTAVM